MKFTFKAELNHTFTHLETVTVTVEAATREEAAYLAEGAAVLKGRPSSWESERDNTSIDKLDLIKAEGEEDEGPPPPIRCDLTADMFGGAE